MIEAELLARLRANPLDDETRSVYADWLEEQGLVHRAAFLRARDVRARHVAAICDPDGARWRAAVTRQPLARCAGLFRQGCATAWEHHATTADDLVRHCATCSQPVFYFSTVEEIERSVAGGMKRCFALDLALDETIAKDRYDSLT